MTKQLDISMIERIVRNIVNEVWDGRGKSVAPSLPKVSKPEQKSESKPEQKSESKPVSKSEAKPEPQDDFLLEKQIVTLRDIAALPPRVKRLQLLQNALVTPAVLDELDERGIRVQRISTPGIARWKASHSPATVQSNVAGELDIYPIFTSYHVQGFLPVWSRMGIQPNVDEGFSCLVKLRQKIAESFKTSQKLSVVVTSKSDEALCYLNRESSLWAVKISRLDDVPAQMKKMETNVIIVNPDEVGVYMLQKLVVAAAEAFEHRI